MRHSILTFAVLALTTAGCSKADDSSDHGADDSHSTADDSDPTGDDTATGDDSGPTDTGGDGPYTESCPTPQAVNTICTDISEYGTRVFTVVSLNEGIAIARAPHGTSFDQISIEYALTAGEVSEGTTDCADGSIVFGLSDGAGDSTYFMTDPSTGTCGLTVTNGGQWASDLIEGTVTATVWSEFLGTRTITGSFEYDASAL